MKTNIPSQLIEALQTAEQVAVLTGAGVSAESGVPTFREAQTGLWAKYRPEELATPQAFRADPQKVWAWYQWRRELIAGVEPNPGHEALAAMEEKLRSRGATFTLITQNVDGLHQQAGSENVIKLHGDITRTKCSQCNAAVERWEEPETPPPHCPHCDGLLRPDVVWFGENLPPGALEAALEAARESDVFFSIGTSAAVQPAASLPILALEAGALVVEINPNRTPISGRVQIRFAEASGVILPRLAEAVWG
jgi:NAD-dependent deacetylase